jgi:ABC-2 type transport system permease protein
MSDTTMGGPRARVESGRVRAIAGREFRDLVRDGRFLWSATIFVVLLIAALATGWQRAETARAIQEQAQESSNSQFYKQGDKNPHSGAHYGNYAFKQVGPLAFFDSGIDPYAGTLLFMEAHKQNLALSPPAGDQNSMIRFGELNGATILQLLLPLLIIFLAFPAFAGERERGTLRQLMSMGVSGRELLWGKALGIAAAVLLVIAPLLAVGIVVILSGLGEATDHLLLRGSLLFGSYLVYGAIFLFLTLGVSALAANLRQVMIVMIGIWAFSVFLAPKLAAELSKRVHPSPSFGEFEAAVAVDRVKGLGGPPPRARLAAYKKELLAKYGVQKVEDLPVYWTALSMQKLEQMDHEVFEHHHWGLRDTYLSQRRLQDLSGLAAPLLPLSSLSMGLAGTDLLHQGAFTLAAEAHRRRMVDTVNDYLAEMATSFNKKRAEGGDDMAGDRVFIADEAFFQTIPMFQYTPPDLSAVNREYRPAYALLLVWLGASILFAVRAATRLKPDAR